MLTIRGRQQRAFCDGVSRRGFLRLGTLGLGPGFGGLSLAGCLAANANDAGGKAPHSVIMVYLPGGLTQSDTFDMKPAAPREVRGPFQPISTCVPGLKICELMPRMAQAMHKVSLVRTIVGFKDRHESFQCYTGRPGGRPGDGDPQGGWPAFGSVVSKLLGPNTAGTPPYMDVGPATRKTAYMNRGQHDGIARSSWPGFLGFAHAPFHLEGQGKGDLVLKGITLERMYDRKRLLQALDRLRRQVDHSGIMNGVDAFYRQAVGILTSSKLAAAMDLSREDPRVIQRYGPTKPTRWQYEAAPKSPQHLLLARRLVEAGVRIVTVAFGAWDWHGDRGETLEQMAKEHLPDLDHALCTLIEDLDERGLLEQTTVVVWGEMGRTPRLNDKGGRDHWPNVSSALLCGGGLRQGVVVGATDRYAAQVQDRPVHVQEVFATLYHKLGIDVSTATVADLSGRPHYLVDRDAVPIRELVG